MQLRTTSQIIDRQGKIVHSAADASVVSAEGYAILYHDDYSCDVFRAADNSLHHLPSTQDGQTVEYKWTNHLCPDTLIAYCIAQKSQGLSPSCCSRFNDTKGLSAVASFATDMQGNPLFAPIPYSLTGYYGEYSLAADSQEHAAVADRCGNIVHTWPDEYQYFSSWTSEDRTQIEDVLLTLTRDSKIYSMDRPRFATKLHSNEIHGPYKSIHELREGVRLVTTMEETEEILDEDWNTIYRFPEDRTYESFEFHRGLLAFTSKRNGKCGLMNMQGDIILKPQFRALNYLGEGYWWYQKGSYSGIMLETGEIITPPQFFYYYQNMLMNGMIPAGNKGSRSGYINLQGDWVLPARYDSVSNFFHPQYAKIATLKKGCK